MEVRCSVRAGSLWLPMRCVGKAYLEGNTVNTWATRPLVAGIPLSRRMRRRIKRRIDPIVDGSTLPALARFERVGTGNGMLEVGIGLDLAALPERLPPDTRTTGGMGTTR